MNKDDQFIFESYTQPTRSSVNENDELIRKEQDAVQVGKDLASLGDGVPDLNTLDKNEIIRVLDSSFDIDIGEQYVDEVLKGFNHVMNNIPSPSGDQHPDEEHLDKMPGEVGMDQNQWSGEGYEEMDINELAGLNLSDKIKALNAMVRSAPMDEQDEYELNRKLFAALELMHDAFLRQQS